MADAAYYASRVRPTTGKDTAAVVQEALTSPRLFVFGELLSEPAVASLASDPELKPTYDLLHVFTYGTYERRHTLPEITPAQLKKLKQLTLVTLASKARNISYDVLQRELDIPDVRVLEDVIIDSITSGLLQGKLDQASRSLEVVDVIGRDVQRSDLDGMIATLGAWAESSTTAINELDRMIRRAKVAEDSRTKNDKEFAQQLLQAFATSATGPGGDGP